MELKTTRPVLEFSEADEKLTDALSAIALDGKDLWVASDERTCVERLTLQGGDRFAAHRRFELKEILRLPAVGQVDEDGEEIDQEIDIEGLDLDGNYLWVVGSHSIKRKKVDPKKDADENIKRLRKTDARGNRFLLGRVPVVRGGGGGESVLAPADGPRKAARLPCTMTDNDLTQAVAAKDDDGKPDLHLQPWLALPGKDNGFDIEGLVVKGEKVFLGLRGPVLRGWAVIMELLLEDGDEGELRLKKIGPKGRAYRKHFLDLGGLGVRDLCLDGDDDLLILAGPTMNLDGPVRLFRWQGGAAVDKQTLVPAKDLKARSLTLPHGDGTDHAEGMTLLGGANPPSILVVYDAPSQERKVGDKAVLADVFGLP